MIGESVFQEKGGIKQLKKIFSLDRKILIVSDDGVPKEYIQIVEGQCRDAKVHLIPQGEESKSFNRLEELLAVMTEWEMSREDAVIAVGGGVVGDLAGLAAGLYMRGIDFYNIPTTLLAQVDSSVGGKTGINFSKVKNVVGLFKQPNAVLVDTQLLKSLSERQLKNGMAEALKMGMILSEELVEILKMPNYMEHLDDIVKQSIELKIQIVEADEKEANLRRCLNYGHTIGHGFESALMGEILHGEAVAIGMLAMAEGDVLTELQKVLNNLGMLDGLEKTIRSLDKETVQEAKSVIAHDKKKGASDYNVVVVEQVGAFEIRKMTLDEIWKKVDGVVYEK